jgi:hypothetical protein
MRWKSLVYRSHLRRRACRCEASIGCRPTTGRKHAAPRTHRLLNSSKALVTQNAVAHIEVLSEEMHAPAKAFWKNRNPATEGPMRSLLTMETMCFHYLHGAGQPERVSRDSWALDQVLFDRPGNAEIEPDLLYDCRNDRPRSTE